MTRDVCLLARMMAATLYYSQIEDLMFEVIDSFTNPLIKSLMLVYHISTDFYVVSVAVNVALQR